MTKSEVMNCAAVLASGIMANQAKITVYNADSAVELMMQLAEKIAREASEPERKYREV